MFRDLFLILFQPKRTLDRLLFEENMGRSWGATWFMAAFSAVLGAINLKLKSGSILEQMKKLPPSASEEFIKYAPLVVTGLLVLIAVYNFVAVVLSRFFFSWYVRMGLRMVAGDSYPQTAEERRENGKKLQLLHPYTMAITLFSSVIVTLLTAVAPMDPTPLRPGVTPDISHLIASMLVNMVTGIVSLAVMVYWIVVRVFAIQKIYRVSGAKAFWGPFIVYFLTDVVLIVLAILVFVGFIAIGIANAQHP